MIKIFFTKFFSASLIVVLALAMLPAMPAGAIGTQVTLTTGASWTVPAGVTNISIECWGAGGGGGARWAINGRGGGGGGGAYAKVLSYAVTPGDVIPYSIGAGGAGGNAPPALTNPTNGGNTTFNTNICVAAGGTGGINNGAGGAGGLASASTGDITANGGSGAQNGGGGSAGVTALGLASATAIAGNNASVCTGGLAVPNGGAGASGNCINQTIAGSNGGFPGGGASGASKGGGGWNPFGGAGAQGRIIITYLPEITTPTVTGIGTTSATLGANFVNANGAMTVSARGICWGTTPAPTTNCTSSGTTTGVYTQLVSGFTAGTLYYYRGYITVESGTGYSEDGTFTADTTLAVTGPSSVTYPATGTLTASGGSSGGTVSFNYVSGGCSLGGANNATLTITNASSTPCVVTATRTAGGNFVAQTSANYNVTLVDNTAPALNSFTRQTPTTSATNADTLVFRATFSEAVQNVNAADFAVTGTTATITGVTGVGAGPNYSVYDITVSGGDLAGLNGTVGLNLAGGQNIADLAGNALPAGEPATDETYVVDNTAPSLTSFMRQTPATSPTNADTLVFRATFSTDVQNVDAADFTVTGTTATITGVAGVGGGPNYSQYDITVSGGDLAGLNGTVGLNLNAVLLDITDLVGNALLAGEPATDNTYVVDNTAPLVASMNLPVASAGTGPSSFVVTFSEDVNNAGGGTGADDAANPANYRIINKGVNELLETAACNVPLGGDDTQILPSGVTYIPNTAIVNLGSALPVGTYRLFVCGTTSIADLAGNHLNSGVDFTFDFVVSASASGGNGSGNVWNGANAQALPGTGFAPHVVTRLPEQPAELAYTQMSNLWLEIPSQNVKTNIVGVPQSENVWDVKWLGNDAGWLNGTAFPSWVGNSIITGHVMGADGLPGPFAKLQDLKYGERIIVHMLDQQYVFEVRNKRLVRPDSTAFAFEHLEDASYLTLVTCSGYNKDSNTYSYRRIIRTVLVEVK